MKTVPVTVILLSAAAGLLLATNPGTIEKAGLEDIRVDIKNATTHGQQAHKHAIFHVVVNGTELDFSSQEFQLNSRYIQLENNMSSVVHTHLEGVRWKDFLRTINTSVKDSKASDLCLEIHERTWCGEGSLVLNGEEANMSKDIRQGDNLLIILNTENSEELIEQYMKQRLPRDFRPEATRGRRL